MRRRRGEQRLEDENRGEKSKERGWEKSMVEKGRKYCRRRKGIKQRGER